MTLEPKIYKFGDFVVHVPERRVYYRDLAEAKRGKVIDLLALIVQTRDQPLNSRKLAEAIWGKNHHGNPRRDLDALFRNLRKWFDTLSVSLDDYVQRDGLARFIGNVECLQKYPEPWTGRGMKVESEQIRRIERPSPSSARAEQTLARIKFAIDENKYDKALEFARELPWARLSPEQLRKLATWYLSVESFQGCPPRIALPAYDMAIKAGFILEHFGELSFADAAENARALILKSVLLHRAGRRDSVLAIYETIHDRYSKVESSDLKYYCATALLNSIFSFNRSGRSKSARLKCDQLMLEYGGRRENPVRETVIRGMRAVAQKSEAFHDALHLYDQIKSEYGRDEDVAIRYQVLSAMCEQTTLLRKLKRYREALELAEEILRSIKPDDDRPTKILNIKALTCKAVCLFVFDQPVASIEICDQIVALTMNKPDLAREAAVALAGKIQRLCSLGRHVDAIGVCDLFVKTFGQTQKRIIRVHLAWVLNRRARLYIAESRDDEATESYDQTVRGFSEDEDPQIGAAIAEAFIGKRSVALDKGRIDQAVSLENELALRFKESTDPKICRLIAHAIKRIAPLS